jgi:anaerobic selenocysteine-containing dehydrogenase
MPDSEEEQRPDETRPSATPDRLSSYPPYERWDDWVEYDPKSWPKKVERRYSLVPTTCFNCEAACGLLAYVDKDSGDIKKLEGNPTTPVLEAATALKAPPP